MGVPSDAQPPGKWSLRVCALLRALFALWVTVGMVRIAARCVRRNSLLKSSSCISRLVHTAAASQLGQMLVKLCKQERMTLLNVVRRDEQAEILRKLGAPFDQSICIREPLRRMGISGLDAGHWLIGPIGPTVGNSMCNSVTSVTVDNARQ